MYVEVDTRRYTVEVVDAQLEVIASIIRTEVRHRHDHIYNEKRTCMYSRTSSMLIELTVAFL